MSDNEILVRHARSSDSADIKALLDRSWRTHWAPHLDMGAWARYEAARPVEAYVDVYLGAMMVAERGGVVVGMYHLDDGMLHAIHVDSWAIGTGVGATARRARLQCAGPGFLCVARLGGNRRARGHRDGHAGALDHHGTALSKKNGRTRRPDPEVIRAASVMAGDAGTWCIGACSTRVAGRMGAPW